MPASGSDFVTAPELTPLFGQALAVQVAEALDAHRHRRGLGVRRRLRRAGRAAARRAGRPRARATRIVDLSGTLRERQRRRSRAMRRRSLARRAARRDATAWWSATRCSTRCRCSCCAATAANGSSAAWCARRRARFALGRPADRRCARRSTSAFAHDYLTEIHPQAEAFVATLADRLTRARPSSSTTAFPRPSTTTRSATWAPLMCHRGHQADGDPLADVGEKDITAHVNFTGIALAGAGRRPRRAGLHQPGALPAQLRPRSTLMEQAPLRAARAGGAADPRARDGRAVQGDRLRQGPATFAPIGFAAATAGIALGSALSGTTVIRWLLVVFLALLRLQRRSALAREASASAACRATSASASSGREWFLPFAAAC